MKWILIANILVWPIAYIVMNKWLQHYAYKTDLAWWVFILAGIVSLLITSFIISFQTIKSANKNPIDILRHE